MGFQLLIPQTGYLNITGKDALDFLHRLSSSDVQALKVNHGTPTTFLSATGKIQYYVYLWNMGDNLFRLEVPIPTSSQKYCKGLKEYLETYLFAEEVQIKIEVEDQLWGFDDSDGPILEIENSDPFLLFHRGSQTFGTHWFSTSAEYAQKENRSTIEWKELNAKRIEQLSPFIDHEILPEFNPLELGLAQCFSREKGCYPGQETIEKILSRGEPAKRLVLLETTPNFHLETQSDLFDKTGKRVGKLTSYAQQSALGIINKVAAKSGETLTHNDQKMKILKVSNFQ